MKTLLSAIVLGFLLLNASCDNSQNEPLPEPPQSVVDKSLDYFDGEVIKKSAEVEDGIEVWEVKIKNDKGAVVKFYWRRSDDSLYEMEGESGPFDYEIVPGNNLINFQAAFTIAKGAVKNDNLTGWKLKKNSKFKDIWVYEFEFDINGKDTKVYIDAANGNVLQID